MEHVAIYGAGGHGKVVWDILRAAGRKVVGFVDERPITTLKGLPVARCLRDLPTFDGIIVAIGDNRTRRRIFLELRAAGHQLPNAVHPSACLGSDVSLGHGVVVAPGAVVNIDTRIGDNVILNTGATIDHDSDVGDHVHIAPGCSLGGTVKVGEGTFLGVGTCVIPGRRLGAWCIVGAGGVVIHDVPDEHLAVGVPARSRPHSLLGRESR